MLIFYYDLDGNPMKFTPKNRPNASQRVLARVRWSNPDIHIDSTGKPIKYQSMKGAPVAFYIPQRIRDMYRKSEPIDTLIIQEGEKKAEKACKEGIPSIGIQGIFNIGSKEDGIPKELQYIVSKCAVRNVVLLFDSDWDHLHRDIKPGDSIDQRPNQFSRPRSSSSSSCGLSTISISASIYGSVTSRRMNAATRASMTCSSESCT